jgi:hypothetical protein
MPSNRRSPEGPRNASIPAALGFPWLLDRGDLAGRAQSVRRPGATTSSIKQALPRGLASWPRIRQDFRGSPVRSVFSVSRAPFGGEHAGDRTASARQGSVNHDALASCSVDETVGFCARDAPRERAGGGGDRASGSAVGLWCAPASGTPFGPIRTDPMRRPDAFLRHHVPPRRMPSRARTALGRAADNHPPPPS